MILKWFYVRTWTRENAEVCMRIAHSRKTLVDARSVTLMRTLGALSQPSLAPMNTLRTLFWLSRSLHLGVKLFASLLILVFMGHACWCDISNGMASEIFTNHIPASMMGDPVKLLWQYTSTSMKPCTPRWSEIHKWRHFLGDLLAANEGRRLRQKEWCRQLAERFEAQWGVLLKSVDEVSLMAYRPRVMLSQLHNFK